MILIELSISIIQIIKVPLPVRELDWMHLNHLLLVHPQLVHLQPVAWIQNLVSENRIILYSYTCILDKIYFHPKFITMHSTVPIPLLDYLHSIIFTFHINFGNHVIDPGVRPQRSCITFSNATMSYICSENRAKRSPKGPLQQSFRLDQHWCLSWLRYREIECHQDC